MKLLTRYIQNLKRLLRIALNSKKMVAVICLISLFGTLLLVKFIKGYNTQDDYNDEDPVLEEAMKGKKAVSLLFNMSDLPVELLYPGVKVDVVDKTSSEVSEVVENVTVVGVSFLPETQQVKVLIAVNDDQSFKVLGSGGKTLGLVILGSSNLANDEIEIVEF